MKKIADENKSNFLIVNLFFTNKDNEKKYEIFFNEKNLNYVNCNINLDKTLLILNDFHPNQKANVLYFYLILRNSFLPIFYLFKINLILFKI